MPCRDYEEPSWSDVHKVQQRADELAAKLCATRHALRSAMAALRYYDSTQGIQDVVNVLDERGCPLADLERDYNTHLLNDLKAYKTEINTKYNTLANKISQIRNLGGLVPQNMNDELETLRRKGVDADSQIELAKDTFFEF